MSDDRPLCPIPGCARPLTKLNNTGYCGKCLLEPGLTRRQQLNAKRLEAEGIPVILWRGKIRRA
jgi:hypothetical protein